MTVALGKGLIFTYTDINITTRVGNATASFPSTSGVKQGNNLAPVLFLFAIQAAVEVMGKDWPFQQPNLSTSTENYINKHETAKSRLQPFTFYQSFYADDAAFVFLSRKELIEGTTYIKEGFAWFGLQVHLGWKANGNYEETKVKNRGPLRPGKEYNTRPN